MFLYGSGQDQTREIDPVVERRASLDLVSLKTMRNLTTPWEWTSRAGSSLVLILSTNRQRNWELGLGLKSGSGLNSGYPGPRRSYSSWGTSVMVAILASCPWKKYGGARF